MLVKIHANIRPYIPTELTRNGDLRKPFVGLRGPGGTNVNIYGGNLGTEGLEKFCRQLKSLAPKTGTEYMELDGVRPNDNGIGFIGFVSDISVLTADPDDVEWAKTLDRQNLRSQVEGQVARRAAELSAPAPVVTRRQPVVLVDAPAGAPLSAEDLFG